MAVWWAIIVVVIVAGVIMVNRDRLRYREAMEREQLLHEARVKAIESGLDPEFPSSDPVPHPEPRISYLEILDRVAQLAGYILLAGGVGYFAGLAMVPETKQTLGMTELAPLGLIPASIGVGLLLFSWFGTASRRE